MSAPRREGLPATSPTLEVLIGAAHADPELRALFKKMERLSEGARLQLLGRMIEAATARSTPAEFQQALITLRDPSVMKKLLQLV